MTDVTLSIAGKDHMVACAPGEENHVRYLGQMIDAKVSQMESGGAQSETRLLLFASLLLADEVHELKQALTSAEVAAESTAKTPTDLTPLLEALATRLENLAGKLETEATPS